MPQYDRLVLQPNQVKCAPPKPVQLGSLKSENDGRDPDVQLVPIGGCGWGRPTDDQDRGRARQPGWAAAVQGKQGTGSSLFRAKSAHPSSRPGKATEQPEKPAQAKPAWNLADVSSSSWHKTQQALGLEREFPELGSTLSQAASSGSTAPTPQGLWFESSANRCSAGGPPVLGPGPAHARLAHVRSSSAHPAPAFSMSPDQMKISLEHKEQQHVMRERALKRQAEKEAEEAEQRREQLARAQEKLMLLEQRLKERQMKEKQDEEEERRCRELQRCRELEKLRRQESPHLRGWPVDHASSNSRAIKAAAVAQGGGPASPHSRGWFIGNSRSCPALTESPAETPQIPPKISILQHEHRTAANVTRVADGGNHGEQHRQDWHDANQGSGCAWAKAALAAVEPSKLLPSHQSARSEHREGGRSNSVGGSSSPGRDTRLVQETTGGDTRSGADYKHQHQHHDNSNHRRKQKQQNKRQMLAEAAQDASVAERTTGCTWSAASYGTQQQQAWSSPVQTWKNSGHLDNTAWQQDGWEERSTAEDEQEARTHWCHWSSGVNWQQHRAEADVQQHWEWSGSDWTRERQGQGRTYYGKCASDYYKSTILQETQAHEQGNGSMWHGNAWQDFKYDHGTQAAGPCAGVPVEDATAAPAAAAAAGAAAKAATSRSRIRVAAREARAALAAGAAQGRHNVGETVPLREELDAVDNHSHRRGDPPDVAPVAAENRSRRRLRAFSDDETSVNHVRRGLRAFSGACSSDEEGVTIGPSHLGLQSCNIARGRGHDTRQNQVSEDLTRLGLRATARLSHHGLRAFSRGASSSSDEDEEPRNAVAAVDGRTVNRGTAKLRAWKSGSRTPPTHSGSRPAPVVSGSRTAAVPPNCRVNTKTTAKEGRDFAAKLFRSVIHPKAAVAVGSQRQQMPHCGGIGATPKLRAEATSEDVVCTSDSPSAADGKPAAPSSGQPQVHREQDDSAMCEKVEDGCNSVFGISNASAESNSSDSTQKAAEGSNNAGGIRSYYGRRDAAAVGGVAISWLASVSRGPPQSSQPQHPSKQEQQQTPLTQQLEEASNVAQDALSVPDPCGDGGE